MNVVQNDLAVVVRGSDVSNIGALVRVLAFHSSNEWKCRALTRMYARHRNGDLIRVQPGSVVAIRDEALRALRDEEHSSLAFPNEVRQS